MEVSDHFKPNAERRERAEVSCQPLFTKINLHDQVRTQIEMGKPPPKVGEKTISHLCYYNIYIMALMVLDFVMMIVYHQNEQETGAARIAITVIWLMISVAEVVDYVMLFARTKKYNTNLFSSFFLIYSLIIISYGFVLVDVIVRAVKGTFVFEQILRSKVSAPVFYRGLVTSIGGGSLRGKPLEGFRRKHASLFYAWELLLLMIDVLYKFFAYFIMFWGFFMLVNEQPSMTVLYFMFVTLSTVGYGDVSMQTGYGRFVNIVFIVISIVFVPIELGNIISAMRDRLPKINFRKNVVNGVLIVGRPTEVLLRFVRKVLPNMFKIAFLALPDSDDDVIRLINLKYSGLSISKLPEQLSLDNLQDYSIQFAQQIVVISDKQSPSGDSDAILQAINCVEYTMSRVPLILILQQEQAWSFAHTQLMEKMPESDFLIVSLKKHVHQMLALAAMFPGYPVFFVNLVNQTNFDFNAWAKEDLGTLNDRYSNRIREKAGDFVTKIRENDQLQRLREIRQLQTLFNKDLMTIIEERSKVNKLTNIVMEIGSAELCAAAPRRDVETLDEERVALPYESCVGEFTLKKVKCQRIDVYVDSMFDIQAAEQLVAQLRQGGQDRVIRVICEQEVPEGSGWIYSPAGARGEVAVLRGCDCCVVLAAASNYYTRHYFTFGQAVLASAGRVVAYVDVYPHQEVCGVLYRSGEVIPCFEELLVSQLLYCPRQTQLALTYQDMLVRGEVGLKAFELDGAGRVAARLLEEQLGRRDKEIVYCVHDQTVLQNIGSLMLDPGDVVVVGDKPKLQGALEDSRSLMGAASV